MDTEECPKAPVEDIVYLKRLGGCGAQMKGLLQGAESLVSRVWGWRTHLGAEAPWRCINLWQKGLGLWVPHAFLPAAAGPCCGKSPTSVP